MHISGALDQKPARVGGSFAALLTAIVRGGGEKRSFRPRGRLWDAYCKLLLKGEKKLSDWASASGEEEAGSRLEALRRSSPTDPCLPACARNPVLSCPVFSQCPAASCPEHRRRVRKQHGQKSSPSSRRLGGSRTRLDRPELVGEG